MNARVTAVVLVCSCLACGREVVRGTSTPLPDSDGDGYADAVDGCPHDAAKSDPGSCGCGVADIDSDQDGALDCNEECDADAAKTEPGACGCGVAETDTDVDGSPDCVDSCAHDPLKTEAGVCGCGVSDADTDADDVLDCNDNCPEHWTEWQWDFDDDGLGDPCDDSDGTAEHPYEIHSAAQLDMIGAPEASNAFGSADHRLGSHYVLVADIDLSSFTGNSFNLIGTVTQDAALVSTSLPGSNALYGFVGENFHGQLDGNGHTISGLTYEASGTSKYIGLFRHLGPGPYVCDVLCTSDMQCDWGTSPFPPGTDPHSVSSGDAEYYCLEGAYRSHGRVENLRLNNFTITAYGAVGAVAGFMSGSRIENVVIDNSTITATSTYSTDSCRTNAELVNGGGAGGAVGAAYHSNTTISNPEYRTGISRVAVTGTAVSGSITVGGVVGLLVFSNVERAYVDNVSLSSTHGYVGGIAGQIRYHDNNAITIDNTYARAITITSSVTPEGAILGGAHCEVSTAADVRHSFMVPDPTTCSLAMVGSGGVLTNVACYPSMGALNATFDEDGDGPAQATPIWNHDTSPPGQMWALSW